MGLRRSRATPCCSCSIMAIELWTRWDTMGGGSMGWEKQRWEEAEARGVRRESTCSSSPIESEETQLSSGPTWRRMQLQTRPELATETSWKRLTV